MFMPFHPFVLSRFNHFSIPFHPIPFHSFCSPFVALFSTLCLIPFRPFFIPFHSFCNPCGVSWRRLLAAAPDGSLQAPHWRRLLAENVTSAAYERPDVWPGRSCVSVCLSACPEATATAVAVFFACLIWPQVGCKPEVAF